MRAAVHASEGATLKGPGLVACRPIHGNGERTYGRAESALLLVGALEQSGVGRETMARALGVSRQVIDRKASGSAPLTVADVLDLIESGGAGLTLAECVLGEIQSRVDARRGRVPPASDLVDRLALLIGGVVGELQVAAAQVIVRREEMLRLCAAARAQIGTLEACVRGMQ